MSRLLADLRLALRSLLRRPGFLAVAVFTLALGVGSVSAIFSVVNGTLLTPLPYAEAERIIRINRVQGPWGGPVSSQVVEDWRRGSEGVFAELAAFVGATVNLTGDGEAERLGAYRVTPEFWRVMGLPALAGRYFTAEEDASRERVVVISHELWQRRFGGKADAVGRDILLNGEAHRIVGITPASFRYPGSTQVYLPTHLAGSTQGRGNNWLFVIARLADGASLAQAEAALQAVNTRLAEEFADNHAGLGARLTPLPEQLNSQVEQPLLVLLGAAALVLLIACANLANLLLARGSVRQRELAVRAALGAGRRALMRAVIADALVIAALGGLLGLLVAALAVPGLLALAPGLLPSHATVGMDLAVVLVALGGGIATVMLFAAVPALRAASTPPQGVLQEDGRGGSGGQRRARTRNALVAFEVALSLTLLVGAGLLIESLRQLGRFDTGVDTDGVLTAAIVLPGVPEIAGEDIFDGYRRHTVAMAQAMDPLLERLAAIPGVHSVGLSDSLPLSGIDNASSNVTVVGREVADGQPTPGANWRFVSPDLFDTLGMRIVAGRNLDAADGRPGGIFQQVLVNETFVRRYLGGVDPLSQQIAFFDEQPKQIVGVVNDTRLFGLAREPVAEVYMPHVNATQRQFYLALKVSGEPMGYAEQVRRAIREVNPDVPVFELRSMDQLAAGTTVLRRFNMSLMSVFSGVALLLAAIGLYGVVAYSVAERRQEFGIRLSLGAQAGDVLRMVLAQGLRMIGLGLVLGLLGAFALGRVLTSQLYGVSAGEPAVFASVIAALIAVGLLACLLPALRAARAEPMLALRNH
jgi:putative ABC transport system permease protein